MSFCLIYFCHFNKYLFFRRIPTRKGLKKDFFLIFIKKHLISFLNFYTLAKMSTDNVYFKNLFGDMYLFSTELPYKEIFKKMNSLEEGLYYAYLRVCLFF